MKLLSLSLANFKGARDVSIAPKGADLVVYGTNGAGKTTLADAWSWVLFGKDSRGRADFDVKTLTPDGKAIPMIDHAVEAEIEDEKGRSLRLRRVYKEVHTKKRGNASAEFGGHTTDYFVNDVPVKESEYAARVSSVCPEAKFQVLTDPAQLVERTKWPDRRKLLVEMIGDVTDADVIASKRSLAKLPGILGEHSIDDFRKIADRRMKAINAELTAIPDRIDEANRAIPTVPSGNWEAASESAERAVADAQAKKASLVSGGAIGEKTVRLRRIEGELIEIANRLKAAGNPERDSALAALREIDASIRLAEGEVASLKRQIAAAEAEKSRIEPRLAVKRAEVAAVKARAFVGETLCPSCGQELPEDRRQAAREEFNAAQAKRIGEITVEGKALRADFDAAESRIASLVQEEDAAVLRLSGVRSDRTAIFVPEAAVIELKDDPSYQVKIRERREIEEAIRRLQGQGEQALAEVDAEIAAAKARLHEANGHILARKQAAGILERIEGLSADEKRLAAEHERLQGELFLTDECIRAKVAMLTDRINARFSLVRFRLFEEQINGGLKECCDVTVGGVPYESLNTASQINAGLDVIDALAAHLNFAPPIFVDRCESVTDVRLTAGQQIRLVVSAADKTLRSETIPRDAAPAVAAPSAPAESRANPEPEEALF